MGAKLITKNKLSEAKQPRPPKKPNLSDYEVPLSKSTKFKEGDIVAVNSPNSSGYADPQTYFRVYHPQYALQYMNSVGIVRLYKNNGYSSKYGVEFEDGNIVPIMSTFLIGPFSSIDNAKLYTNKHSSVVDIKPEHMVGFDPEQNVETALIEEDFKKAFVNNKYKFQWLDQPVVIKYKNFDVYVLAIKKNLIKIVDKQDVMNDSSRRLSFVNRHNDVDRLDNPNRPEYNNCFVFFKVIDKATKKLRVTSSLTSSHKGKQSGSYGIQVPEFARWHTEEAYDGSNVTDPMRLFYIGTRMLGLALTKVTESNIATMFDNFDNCNDIKTGWDHFKILYKIREDATYIKIDKDESVKIHESLLGKDLHKISRLYIDGPAELQMNPTSTTVKFFPSFVKGQLCISGLKELHSLENFDKCNMEGDLLFFFPVKSLEHFPENINKKTISLSFKSILDSLKGIPNELHCDLRITELKHYWGAENCVVKSSVAIDHSPKDFTGFFKDEGNDFRCWRLDREKLEEFKKFRGLEQKLPELEGIFN